MTADMRDDLCELAKWLAFVIMVMAALCGGAALLRQLPTANVDCNCHKTCGCEKQECACVKGFGRFNIRCSAHCPCHHPEKW